MTAEEEKIADAFYTIFQSFSPKLQLEILKQMTEIYENEQAGISGLEKSFGKWESEKSAEAIIAEINQKFSFSDEN